MDHSGIVLAVVIVGLLGLAMAIHDVVVAPCRATTSSHTVTNSVGTYRTE